MYRITIASQPDKGRSRIGSAFMMAIFVLLKILVNSSLDYGGKEFINI
jgi:hypothetical protein